MPELIAVEQFKDVMVPDGRLTALVKVQVCPPILKAKLAVPLLAGVPVMEYVKLPPPFAKFPVVKEAVNPDTPVDDIFCAE